MNISSLTRKNAATSSFEIILLVLLSILSETSFAQVPGYTYRTKITIAGTQVCGNNTDFPLLISQSGNFLRAAPTGLINNANGYDIVFTAANGTTLLSHQIDHYNGTTGTYAAWVKIPSLNTGSNTDIYMYYGNSSVTTDPSTTNTWNANFRTIYHFQNNIFNDATANAINSTNNNTTATTAKIGEGRDFNGTTGYVQTNSTELQTLNNFTLSAWFKADATSASHIFWQGLGSENGWGNGAPGGQEMNVSMGMCCPGGVTGPDYISFFLGDKEEQLTTDVLNAEMPYTNTTTWQYVVAVMKNLDTAPVADLYLNGALIATNTGVVNSTTARGNWNTNLRIGRPGANSRYFNGQIDEARVSNVARSTDWICTEFNNQNNPSAFMSFINDAPDLGSIEGTNLNFTEDGAPIAITSAIVITDENDGFMSGATIQISTNYVNTEDVLAFANANGITGSWSSVTGILTLTGTATVANYQAALRSVTYQNTNTGHPSNATRTIRFTVNDGVANSNSVTRNITVTRVNDAPVAVADAYTITEGGTLTRTAATGVLINDTDAEGSALTAVLGTTTTNGTLTLNANGSFTYVHNGGETTSDSFTYRANDGTVSGALTTVTITVTPVNDAPVAVADAYTVAEGGTINQTAPGVLSNDTDAEGNTLTTVLGTTTANGTLTLNANGSFTYVHNGSETTSDSFTYRANDGTTNGNLITVTITVTPVNDAPVGVADSYTVAEGGTLTRNPAQGVLPNDSDAEGNSITAVLGTTTANGTLTLNANGSFTYVHNGGETTSDSFTYRANDGTVSGALATVTITITPVNDAPVAVADAYTVAEGGTLTRTAATGVLINDTDAEGSALTAVLGVTTTNGTLTLNADGSFTYVHNGGETTSDSFTYRANDGTVSGALTTVTIAITPVNDAPVAIADAYTVAEGGTLTRTAATGVLINDTDAEGSALTAVLGTTTANGTLTLNANGSFTYVHNGGETTSDSFTYRANDGTVSGALATVTITITPVNDAPVAVADAYTVAEGGTLTRTAATGVLINDTDAEGSALTAVLGTTTANGTLTLNANGSFTYVHNGGETTSDSFTYRANDGTVSGALATVTITITPVNDAPVAVADAYAVAEGGTLTRTAATGVLINDTDAEGSALTAVLGTTTTNGTLTLNADGSFTYVHNGGETTSDSFTYRANDGTISGALTTVTIAITPVNDAPVAIADAYTVAEGGTLTRTAATGVLINDTDAEGSPLTAVLGTTTTNGTLTLNANGSFTYIHNGGETTSDSFTYRANDGTISGALATVTITITPVNDAPVAVADAYTIAEGGTLTRTAATGVLINDTDAEGSPLTAVLGTTTTNGTLTLNANGSFTYIHNGGETTSDSFTYRANDGTVSGALTTVTITITPVNDNPVAVADSYTVAEGGTLTRTAATGVLINDTDAEGSALTAVLGTTTTNGTLTLNADGSFTYVHNGGETTSDSFTYRANDGTVSGALATVTITITPVNDAPVAVADAYTVAEGGTLTRTAATGVLINDTDAEGSALTAVLGVTTTNGTLTLNADGSFTYVHNGGETTSDSFTYRANDGTISGALATVTITITPVNDAPVAVADSYTVAEGGTLTRTAATGVLINDTDVEGSALTAVLGATTTNGTLTLNADGSFTYIHNGGETTSDSFTYRANDGTISGALATVTITITPVNDAPVAIADAYTVAEGGTLTRTAATGVLINDTDAEGSALTAVLGVTTTNGTLTLNADGSFTYVHNGGETTSDSFTYRANDGTVSGALATVTITITPVNDAPVAVADAYTVAEGGTLTRTAATGVLINDTDAEGSALTAVLGVTTTNGTLTLNANGSFTYVHNGGETTSDSFTYRANDGTISGALTTVTIAITPVNDAPVAIADAYTVAEGGTLTRTAATGVLINDTDAEGSALTAVLGVTTTNGTLTLNADGSFTYVHNGGETTSDSFTYRANDGTVSGALATVTITITPVNDAPVAVADAYTVAEGGTLTRTAATGVLINDTDAEGSALTAVLGTTTTNGTLTLNANGSFTYVHNGGETTSDSFTYRANDGTVSGALATVTITITPVNDAPVAVADAYTVAEGGTLTRTAATGLLINDTDAEGSALTAVLGTTTTNGTLTLNADGSFSYVHNGGETTSDSFTYRANDGTASGALATVTITITPVNDVPVTMADSYSVVEGGTINQIAPGVLANDIDADGNALTAILGSTTINGTLTLNANGSFVYVHDGTETTSDSFTYRTNDGTVNGNLITVSITIAAVNNAPVTVADSYSVTEGGTLTQSAPGVLSNDTDPEGNTLTTVLGTTTANGTLTLNANGSFTYVHNGSETTSDNFTYYANDGFVNGNLITVTITITPVNDAPVTFADSYTLAEGGTINQTAPGVLSNDTDAEGNTLTTVLGTTTTNGTLTLNANGSFTYVHNGGETTSDSFTYRANDGTVSGALATVTITITPVNDNPVAVADAYTVAEGGTLTRTAATGVLINDTDAEGSALTAVLGVTTTNGTLTLNADGSFTYIHNGGETTSDSFTYRANDGTISGALATVTITITPVNDAPVAVADAYTVAEGGTLTRTAATGVLINDTDAEVSALTAVLGATTTNGTLTLNTDGSFTYIHNGGETTSDSFTYRANDGTVSGALTTVTITITPVNDNPIAVADSYTVAEGGTLTRTAATGVLVNDTDAEGSALTAVLGTTTTNGTLTLNADGSFSYVHNGGETTSDSFTYRANDGTVSGALATVTITITPVNDAPVAVADAYTVAEGGTINQTAPGVLSNDTDAEGSALTTVLGTTTTNGTLTLNANGSFTYVHNGSETLSDSFTYRANDGAVNGNSITVLITVTPVNDAPVTIADTYTVAEGGTINQVAPGILSNDTDAEGNTLTSVLGTTTANGVLTLNANGSFTYVHNGSETTSDTFTYQSNDGTVNGNMITVSITITPINDAPQAVNDNILTPEDTPSAINVLANDNDSDNAIDATTVLIVTSPANGSVSVNATTGVITYTPNLTYNGTDAFTYTVKDALGVISNIATVNVTVSSINNPPVANNDNTSTAEDVPAAINVLTNDTDVDNALDPSTVLIITGPSHGTVAINTTTGIVTYTPNLNYNGNDSFTYSVDDVFGAVSNVATVSITVTPVNDAPVTAADSYSTTEGGTINVIAPGVLSNDNDVEGSTLTAVLGTTTTNGTLTLNANGSFTYVHNGTETTADSFTYTANDGTVNGNPVTVSITIAPVNDSPVATADIYSVAEGGTINQAAAGVLLNDTDAEGSTLTAVLIATTTNGTVTLNANGSFAYIHNGGETTSDSFTYTANDGTINGNTVTVTITITPVNDAPVTVADAYSVTEGGTINQTAPGVLLNDTDAEGSALTTVIGTTTTHGTLTLNVNGSFTYVHDGSETTADSFTYAANDGTINGNTVTVLITITPVNDAPVTVADVYSVTEGGTINQTTPGVLVNDSDAEGNALTAIIGTSPTNGTLTLNANGSFTYSHNGSETTSDSFTYTANDGTVNGNTVIVNITITPVNDAPTAVADAYSVAEGGTINQTAPGLLANDNDAEGSVLTAIIGTTTTNGTLTLNANGSFTYIHNGSETTSDSFTYTANDGTIASSTVTVNITITPVNDAPVTVADAYSVAEGGTINQTAPGVLANDSDAEGSALTTVVGTTTAHGILTLNANGSFTYVHDGSETTSDSFTYTTNDGTINGNTVTVAITITPVNDAPATAADTYSVVEGGTINQTAPGVLINDSDAEASALTTIIGTTTAHGTLTLNANGSFTYVHDGSETTSDSFTYVSNDGTINGNFVTVSIIITPVNDVPVAAADAYSIAEGGTLTTTAPGVLLNDVDPDNTMSALLISTTSNGTLTLNADGSFTYVHDGSETTADSFTYKVNDGTVDGNTVTATIAIVPVDDAPVATTDSYSVSEGDNLLVTNATGVLGNDSDPDNSFTAILVSAPSNGILVLNGDGSFSYTHDGSETTADSFTYKVNDGIIDGNTVTVTIAVTPVNDAPVATADVISTLEDTPAFLNILSNDTDADNTINLTSIVVTSTVSHGVLSIDAAGVATYTPSTGYLGTDSFTYTINDISGAVSNTATVTINVTPVNNTPVAISDVVSQRNNQAMIIDVLNNDSDPDNDVSELTILSVTEPEFGSVSIVDGNIVYLPEGDKDYTVTFTYTIQDPEGLTSEATVTLNYVYLALEVSEGFSPNGDGENDAWYIQDIESYPINTVRVFDRWGIEVYTTKNYNNTSVAWDGRANAGIQAGQHVDQGTYYYALDLGHGKILSGYIVILK